MRTEANIDQWKDLYEITIKIKELEPWKYLWDVDIISMLLPGREEPCYVSIMGRNGDCYGINTYVGYDGINDFNDIALADNKGMPADYVMFEQSALACYFDDRDGVPIESKKLIKELGFKFRGKKQWIYFESFKKGYTPYLMDKEEVELLIEGYRALLFILRVYIRGELEVDFDKGETLMARYDEKKECWQCYGTPLIFPKREYPDLILTDDIFKAKMKKMNKIDAILELDMIYLHTKIADKKYDRPVNAKMLLLMDSKSGMAISQDMIEPETDEVQAFLNHFIGFILKYGRMKQVVIRNPYIISMISDLCKECDIKIKKVRKLKAVDAFTEKMREFF